MLRIVVLLLISLLVCACGIESEMTEDLPYFSLNKAAHESTHLMASVVDVPMGMADVLPPVADTGWTQESIDAWEEAAIAGLDQHLADGFITEKEYVLCLTKVHAFAQHESDRLLNIDYHIYSGVANPEDGGLTNRRGWEVNVVYGVSLTKNDFLITISGDWDVQDFSSTIRDDGNYDIYFFIATKSRRGIIDWKGLVQSIALDGNVR